MWSGSNACCIPNRKPSPRIGKEIIGRSIVATPMRRGPASAPISKVQAALGLCRAAMTFGSLAISPRDPLIQARAELERSRWRTRVEDDATIRTELIAVKEHAIRNLRAVGNVRKAKSEGVAHAGQLLLSLARPGLRNCRSYRHAEEKQRKVLSAAETTGRERAQIRYCTRHCAHGETEKSPSGHRVFLQQARPCRMA